MNTFKGTIVHLVKYKLQGKLRYTPLRCKIRVSNRTEKRFLKVLLISIPYVCFRNFCE